MTITVTIRPNGARTEVRGLPWTRPGGSYDVLETAIGATRRGQVQYSDGAFTVSRSHTTVLIRNLADRYGHVHVIQYGGLDRCVAACWTAEADHAWLCQCSCAGRNHGTGVPIGPIVSDGGPGGALSVASLPPNEYDVYGFSR